MNGKKEKHRTIEFNNGRGPRVKLRSRFVSPSQADTSPHTAVGSGVQHRAGLLPGATVSHSRSLTALHFEDK